MTAVQILQQQQAELMALMAELAERVDPDHGGLDEPAIRDCLERLDGKMHSHSLLKASHLYSTLLATKDPETVGTALEYRHEEVDLWRQFRAFVSRWSAPGSIGGDADLFRAEALATLAAIEDRGTREFELLYPIAHQLQAAA